MDQNTNTVSWQAPEFRHYHKSTGWYVTLFIIAALMIAFFIFQQDYFGVACVAIIALLAGIFASQKPRTITITLTPTGISLENLHFPYKQLRSFWIVNNEKHRTVNFETSTVMNRHLVVELEDQNPETVHEYLLQFLPEHSETEETAIQRIMHKFRF